MPVVPAAGAAPALSLGPEARIGGVQDAAAPTGGGSFGSMLAGSVRSLQGLQDQAASASQALATGQAADPTQVVMAVERAQMAMQMASTLRTKGVDAMSEIMRTQV